MLLAIVMVFSFAGFSPVHAAEAAAVWDGTVDISWYDPGAAVYEISTPAQLAGLAALVNGMTDPKCPKVIGNRSYLKSTYKDNVLLVGAGGGNVSGTVYYSSTDFAYKTVRLTADLDMGGVYNSSAGTWSGPNWTPVGGKFPMIPGETKGDCKVLDTRFNGVFDGQGHTVKNVYCNRFAEKGFPFSMAIALIGYLGGSSDDKSADTTTFEKGWKPTVKNVIMGKGSIYGRRMVGGVVGRVGATSNGIVIENCANYADVKNTDSKGVGGVCGSGFGKGVIRNCYNAGSVTTTYSCPAGGICGSNGGMDIYNCYSVGKINSNGEKIGRGIGGHDSGSYTVGNCYYLSGSDDDDKSNGYYKGSSTRVNINVSKLSEAEMKNASFIDKLNSNGTVFVRDDKGINNGYPVLWYQNGGGTGTCKVTVQNPASGGTLEADAQTAQYGQVVNFMAHPAAGFVLDHFTVNGNPISTSFFSVTGDITVGAVFNEVKNVLVKISKSEDYYLAVLRTGYKLSGGQMTWVTDECLSDGDGVLQGNTLKILAHGYEGACPADADYEYTDGFRFAAENCTKNPDGTYTVKGTGNISVTAERGVRRKAWTNFTDTTWYDANPAAGTYTIKSAPQLAGLAYLVNEKGITFKGTTVILGSDISLSNIDGTSGERTWSAVGSGAARPFQGTFDGNGYKIIGLAAWNDGSYSGLFGCCTDAVLKNIKIKGTSGSEAETSYAAGVVAYASGGRIENCIADVDIEAKGTHAGGIAACISDGTVITDSFNYGNVSGTSGVGGILGVSNSGDDVVEKCANFGKVNAEGSETYGVGGIAGRLAGSINSCVNKGSVASKDRYTGGLVGYATTRFTTSILLSKNTGSVSSDSDNENAAVAGLVGYAQYLSQGGNENAGQVSSGSKFRSPYKDSAIGRIGDVKDIQPEGEIPEFRETEEEWGTKGAAANFTVTFMTDEKIVSSVECTPGSKTVAEPAVPAVAGKTGYWSKYQLSDRDVIVKAFYRQNLVKNGEITENGVYYIPWFASGEISIGENLNVTLKGENGGTAGFTGLALSVGNDTKLVLDRIQTTGATTLLKLGANNTLTLSGGNVFSGTSDAKNNEQPTATVQGNLQIGGGGSLRVSSQVNNAAVFVKPGCSVTQNSGTLEINKKDLLGVAGGALYANGSSVTIKGGIFRGHTNSDNVAVVSAQQITIAGGSVRVHCERSPQTLVSAKTILTGGTILAIGHSGNSAPEKKYYYNQKSIPNFTGSATAFRQVLSFTDLHADNPYYDGISYCYNKKYFSGTSKTAFSPSGTMTRAMFASVLYRMAGSPKVNGNAGFSDLTQNWYKNAVTWAVQSGITSGTGKTTFSPNAPITREQAAVFLYKFAEFRGKSTTLQNNGIAVPAAVSGWASQQVRWTMEKGIFTAESGVMETPGINATRELLAQALMRYDSLK